MRHEIFKGQARIPLKRRNASAPAVERAIRHARAARSPGDTTKGHAARAAVEIGGGAEGAAALGSVAGIDPAGTGAETFPLTGAIEREIIPRLLLAHQKQPLILTPLEERPRAIGDDLVPAFLALIRKGDVEGAIHHVQHLRQRGVSHEALYLDVLTPAARALGSLWLDDRCDFTEVTVCTWRLQEVLRVISQAVGRQSDYCGGHRRRFLLTSVKGEQHTFGLSIIEAFLRHAGWDVLLWPGADIAALSELVAEEWFSIVGVTCAGRDGLDLTAPAIHAMRRASRNRALGVMAGGIGFVEHPEWASKIGADATAADGRATVSLAHNLIALLN